MLVVATFYYLDFHLIQPESLRSEEQSGIPFDSLSVKMMHSLFALVLVAEIVFLIIIWKKHLSSLFRNKKHKN